jgi:subtilisin family serine protease
MSAILTQELEARGVAPVIVVLKDRPAPGIAAKLKPMEVGSGAGASRSKTLAAKAKTVPQLQAVAAVSRHFKLRETTQRSALAAAGGRRPAPLTAARFYPNLGVLLGNVDKKGLSALRSDPHVSAVSGAPPLSLIRPVAAGAVARPKSKVTWGIEALGAPKLWKKGLMGDGVLVAHLDTGADGRHPSLKKAIAQFAEFDDLGRRVSPDPSPHDTDDHGTHTAATIAGRPVGNFHVGVAHGATLASAIVIEGGDVIARVLAGMDWSVGLGAKVLSMSLGFRGWWDDFRALTDLLRFRGVLPVFAVGNEGPGTSRSPGNYPEALSIGAHDSDSEVADFSSSQRFTRAQDPIVPDLVAPGVDVISAKPGGGWQAMDGTSMATPHIAGLAALLFEAAPTATVDQVEAAILASCVRPAGMDPERGNGGIPDAVRALRKLEDSL